MDRNELTPIGFVQPGAASGYHSGVFTLATDSAQVKHTGRAKMLLEQPGVMNLRNGETLVNAQNKTVIKAGNYKVAVAAGTIALITREGEVVKIRNAYENSAGSIAVYVGNRVMKLSVGHEMLIGPNDGSVSKALKSEAVGRRSIKAFDVPGNNQVITCDYSLTSLVHNTDILTRLMKSENHGDRAIADKLVKMAAVLSTVTAGRGAYSPVTP